MSSDRPGHLTHQKTSSVSDHPEHPVREERGPETKRPEPEAFEVAKVPKLKKPDFPVTPG